MFVTFVSLINQLDLIIVRQFYVKDAYDWSNKPIFVKERYLSSLSLAFLGAIQTH